jgi:hypothetical protein
MQQVGRTEGVRNSEMTRAWNYATSGKKERRKLHDYKLHNLQNFPSNIQPS